MKYNIKTVLWEFLENYDMAMDDLTLVVCVVSVVGAFVLGEVGLFVPAYVLVGFALGMEFLCIRDAIVLTREVLKFRKNK